MDKGKSSNFLLNYFNQPKTKPDEEKNEDEATKPCTSSNIEEDSNSVSEIDLNGSKINTSHSNNANDGLNSDRSATSEVSRATEADTTSKKPHQDIKTLLMNQKKKDYEDDGSDLDADIIIEDDDIAPVKANKPKIELLKSKSSKSATEKTADLGKKPQSKASSSSNSIMNLLNKESESSSKLPDTLVIEEDIDYVLCQHCNKKILCWDYPEHEDFHYAKMISKNMAREENLTELTNKKRSAEDLPSKSNSESLAASENQGGLLISKTASKKMKIDMAASNKSSVKSIDNYFKKLNKN